PLLPELQPFGQRGRKPSRADSGGGCSDVVLRAPICGFPGIEVEFQPGRARVTIARLADASWIDQPLAARELELLIGVLGLASRQLPRKAPERQRDVGVP